MGTSVRKGSKIQLRKMRNHRNFRNVFENGTQRKLPKLNIQNTIHSNNFFGVLRICKNFSLLTMTRKWQANYQFCSIMTWKTFRDRKISASYISFLDSTFKQHFWADHQQLLSRQENVGLLQVLLLMMQSVTLSSVTCKLGGLLTVVPVRTGD